MRAYNFGECWRDGRAICALLNRFKSTLLDYSSLNVEDVAGNRRLAFALIEREFGSFLSRFYYQKSALLKVLRRHQTTNLGSTARTLTRMAPVKT